MFDLEITKIEALIEKILRRGESIPKDLLDYFKNLKAVRDSQQINTAPSRFRRVALSNAYQIVKEGAGNLFGWNLINPNTSEVYVKFFNSAAPTVGSTTPLLVLLVPPGPGSSVTAQGAHPFLSFDTALTVACVTGLADSSNAAPAAGIHAEVAFD